MVALLSFFSILADRIRSAFPELYINYLRKRGVKVGENTKFFGSVHIDPSRPYLVEIGRNCILTGGVSLTCHSYDWGVLREKYGEFLPSSGKIVIEDNVFVGGGSIILKGVRIGRDSIIGAASVVTNDIPQGSVAAGNPCRVIMTIEEYYRKRKKEYLQEAKSYALELYKKTRRVPKPEDFWDEYPIFSSRNIDWENIPRSARNQLGSKPDVFLKSKPVYASFKDFLVDSGIPSDEIEKQGCS
jgi:acetyltransferase-like isoleucine patch superfamily enzyme